MRGYLLGQIVTHIRAYTHTRVCGYLFTWMQKEREQNTYTKKDICNNYKTVQRTKERTKQRQKHICFTFVY